MSTVDEIPYGEPVIGLCPVCKSDQQLSKHALRGAEVPVGPVVLSNASHVIGTRFRCSKCDNVLAHQGIFGRLARFLLLSGLLSVLGWFGWLAVDGLSGEIKAALDGEISVLIVLLVITIALLAFFGASAVVLGRAMRRVFGGAYLVTRKDGAVPF